MMQNVTAATSDVVQGSVGKKVLAVLAGVVVVALGAQAAFPIPGNPVPITLQVPAVLIVGGLLGPRLGAAALVTYLLVGSMGAPVFAPAGVPGFARLISPTGGYLLAYPVAAALVGFAARHGRGYLALGLVGGLIAIHAGGVAQLAALGGDVGAALRFGSLPFLAGDAVKLLFAGLIIDRFGPGIGGALAGRKTDG